MTDVAVTALGGLACFVPMWFLRPRVRRKPHVRVNYRRRKVWATAGIVLFAPLAVGTAAGIVLNDGVGKRTAVTIGAACAAMAVLGLIDDVYGDRQAGGLFGHIRALFKGTFTTGMAKAAGGAAIGLVASYEIGHRGVWIVVGGAVVALGTNLANLLDLRPGRAVKLWYPCAIVLVAFDTHQMRVLPLLALTGGVSVFLFYDLRERVMLGDTGAGLIGCALGVAAVQALHGSGLLICLAVLAALTLVSEVASFTEVIENVPALRKLDELGREPPPKQRKKRDPAS